MLHPLGPRHIGDVDQSVDAGLDFDEGAEAGEVADLTGNLGPNRVFERQDHPGILLGLLHAERDLLIALIDLEHDGFNGFPDAHDFRWMSDVAGPTHFGDVDQSFDAGLQLDERAVIGDRDDLPLESGANRIFLGHIFPRVLHELLHPQTDPLAVPVDVEDLDLEFRADLH